MSLPPHDVFDTWNWIISQAWLAGIAGDYRKVSVLTAIANEAAMGNAYLPTTLEVARHCHLPGIEEAKPDPRYLVQPFAFDENEVWGLKIDEPYQKWPNYDRMSLIQIDGERLKENMASFMSCLDRSELTLNLFREMPHVMVMSTGRCGTVSLHRLFDAYGLAYHVFPFNLPACMHYDMLCRLVDNRWDTFLSPSFWAKTRMAEWIGAAINESPMVSTSHRETVFAPVMAALHPKSKFLYLRRNEEDTFLSFYMKGQWSKSQIGPILYDYDLMNGHFRWRPAIWDMSEEIAWNLKFTEVFCRAFGELMGDRFLEISSDALFAQDLDEIKKLIDFVGIDIPFKEAVDHFKTRHNSKAHKVIVSDRMIANALNALDRPLNE